MPAPSQGLTLLSPLDLPLRRGFSFVRSIAFRLLARRIRRVLEDWQSKSFVYLVYHPEGVRVLESLDPAVVAYDCVDDLVTQPHIASRPRLARALLASESRLIERADLVFATSPALAARLVRVNPRTHLITNVADFDHFSTLRPEPPGLKDIPRPRAAYAGALDPYKLDYSLIEGLLTDLPDLHLVLIGPACTAGPNPALNALESHPRVHHLGVVEYQALPGYLQAMDVLIMPYVLSDHTRHIFPLKTFEYLATGRPVVSSPLEALGPLGPAISLCDHRESWSLSIRRAIQKPEEGRESRQELARRNTWDERVSRIEALLETALTGGVSP